eukprot:2925378-Amphidinium_carterae.1
MGRTESETSEECVRRRPPRARKELVQRRAEDASGDGGQKRSKSSAQQGPRSSEVGRSNEDRAEAVAQQEPEAVPHDDWYKSCPLKDMPTSWSPRIRRACIKLKEDYAGAAAGPYGRRLCHLKID